MIRKLKELRLEMRRRMHIPLTDQWRWLSAVLRGHYGYYGLTGNYRAMKRFLQEVEASWQRALARRSQKTRMYGPRFFRLLRRLPLPTPSIINPYRESFQLTVRAWLPPCCQHRWWEQVEAYQ